MTSTESQPAATRRALIVRDTLTFLALFCVTAVLFGVTWLLFRSFTVHRGDLARRWSDRGRAELDGGRPDQARLALRTALSYAPDDYEDQLLLAEALGAAGHTEEATNYFLGLWETRPGDGFLNLQLARLARKSGNAQGAIDYYRASIFGSWQGQGVERRREVRLELAGFLVERHDLAAARAELLIAGSNTPGDPQFAINLGDALLRAQDPADALTYYQKAIAALPETLNARQQNPLLRVALERAGRLAYDGGQYAKARTLLIRAEREKPQDAPVQPELTTLIESADRLLALDLSRDLPARQRTEHLLDASTIAERRLDACMGQLTAAPANSGAPASLLALNALWTPLATFAGRNAIAHDPDTQDRVAQLIGDTEAATAKLCGTPTGDDAVLLRLVTVPNVGDR